MATTIVSILESGQIIISYGLQYIISITVMVLFFFYTITG